MKKKHKITLLVIGILLVLSLMLSSSYALWVFNVSQESTNVLVSDCFEITLTDNNPIGLGASFPMRDGDGVQTTPYTFTIRNICNHPADFQINLETLSSSTIDEEFIKADLNGHITEYNVAESVEPTIDGARSAAMLYEDTLEVNGEKTYNLRIWVNEIATQEDVENKSYASKVSVKATVRKQYAVGMLMNSDDLNIQLKKLAGTTGAWYSSFPDKKAKSFTRVYDPPTEEYTCVNISANPTEDEILACVRDNNGEIIVYSENEKIYLNPESDYLFGYMKEIVSIDLSGFDTSKVTDMSGMFRECLKLSNLNLENFDTSSVVDMRSMFSQTNLSSIDLHHFNTSKVTNMSYMFYAMSNLQMLDLSSFDTSNVTNMKGMFNSDINLEFLNISGFNTSKLVNMEGMFENLSKIEELDLSSFDTSNVTNMLNLFKGTSKLSRIDLSNFNTSKVTNMSGMFYENKALLQLDLSSFDTSNVTDMSWMFFYTNLQNIILDSFNTSKVLTMKYMFSFSSNLKYLDISNFDTSNVTNMSNMFGGFTNSTKINMGTFDTSNVTDMSGMFNRSNVAIFDLSKLNTSKVTDMSSMFQYSSGVDNIDLSFMDTSNVINMSQMFDNSKFKSIDFSSFNTSKVENIYYMFGNTNIDSIDLSGFDFSSVKNMGGLFYQSKFTSINLSGLTFSSATDMRYLFSGVTTLTSMDLSSFDTHNVTNMVGMFRNASNIQIIYVGNNFDTTNVTSYNNMFLGCTSLVGGAGTTFDANHIDKAYAHVDGGTSNPGYFTLKTN